MVGRAVLLDVARPAPPPDDARARLAVEGLRVRRADGTLALDGVDLTVRAGEILGVAGVEGNGQTELALAVAGVAAAAAGRVRVDGVDVTREPVRARQRRGVGHVPEDRQGRGLILSFSVEDNLLLGREEVYARPLELDRARLRADAEQTLGRLDVRPPDPALPALALSGGNQQKVVLGRELARDLAVLVCAQPTRGVDVGAIERIHEELLGVRARGGAVLLLSAELDELCAIADRIAVLYRGRVVGTIDNRAGVEGVRAAVGALMLGAR
jgi:simple sugar transport system ATP-binding protein